MKSSLLEQLTATDKKIVKIELGTIQGKGLQTRAVHLCPATVAEYAEVYRAGGAMPPIVVFSDGGDEFYLADGHNRVAAARKADLTEIDALIKKGDRRAALWYATAANAQHGLARTNEDKRRAVALILADVEWRQLSDALIAEHASVSDRFVGKLRKEQGAESATRKGKDGKTHTKPAAKPKPTPNRLESDGQDLAEIARMSLDEIAEVVAGTPRLMARWSVIKDLRGFGYTHVRGRLLTALANFPATSDCAIRLDVLRTHSGIHELDSELKQLVDGGIVHQDPYGCVWISDALQDEIESQIIIAKISETKKSGAQPATGPEDLTVDSVAAPAPPPAETPAFIPVQTTGDLILIAERGLISVELLKGKPQWTGADTDLLALALIVGVPTRKLSWIDSVRANARHLFVDALRSEVADRVRNGEHTNRGWPVTPELCRLWGLDYQALHLRAQHAAEK